MARKPLASPSPTTLVLEGDLDLFAIHQQWELVQPLLQAEGPAVVLDLKGIGDIDLSGVQLLASLAHDLQAKGISLSLAGAQEAWEARFTPLGLAQLFTKEAS